MTEKEKTPNRKNNSLEESGELAPGDTRVCFCHNVAKSTIVEAIKNGAKTLEDIQAETCASTGCGGCQFEVEEILEEESGDDSAETKESA